MKCYIKTNTKQMLPDTYPSVSGLTMATKNTKNIYTQTHALTLSQQYLIFYLHSVYQTRTLAAIKRLSECTAIWFFPLSRKDDSILVIQMKMEYTLSCLTCKIPAVFSSHRTFEHAFYRADRASSHHFPTLAAGAELLSGMCL